MLHECVPCSLGVCPQFDILWPEITVREHLTLYAEIKGYNRQDARAVADAAAHDVGQRPSLHAALVTGCAVCHWMGHGISILRKAVLLSILSWGSSVTL